MSLMESLSTTFLEKGEAQGAVGVMRGISSAPRLQMTLRYQEPPPLGPYRRHIPRVVGGGAFSYG